jgi:hypothetical protein
MRFISSDVLAPPTTTSKITHRVRNSIFWSNHLAGPPGYDVHWATNLTNRINLSIQNSFVRGSASINWTTQHAVDSGFNHGIYPGFVDTATFNLKLACGAAAVNKGSNAAAATAGFLTDVNGAARIQNGIVDAGAHEADTNAWPSPAANPIVLSVSGNTVSFATGATPAIPDSVRWIFGDQTTSTLPNPTKTYAAAGLYTVCLMVYSKCGNADSCIAVTVASNPTYVHQVGNAGAFVVYPNPARDFVTVKGVQSGTDIMLADVWGRTVRRVRASSDEVQFSLENLPTGSYLIIAPGATRQMQPLQKVH